MVDLALRSLARDLGVRLVEPDGRGIRLTPAALDLLDQAEELFARWEQIRGRLDRAAPERVRSLRVCGFSTAAAALLPATAARVTDTHPGCAVRIIEADPQECFDLLLAGRADVAVVVAVAELPPRSDPRFEQFPLLDDPLDLLVPAEHRLASRAAVLLREAASERWILDRPGRPHHLLVQTACAAAGFSPAIAHEAAEWDTGAALVAAGLGVALVPRLARLPGGYPVTRVPLRGEPSPARHIVTAVRRGSARQPAVATALAALHDLARQVTRPRPVAGR